LDKKNNVIKKENKYYKKSNLLISSKYRSSLAENKILALAMSRATKEDGRAVARISASELKDVLYKGDKDKKTSGSFYTQLKNIALEMTGRKIFIENIENRSFSVINLVGSATYGNNVFTVKFEPDITDYLLNLKSNYTNLNIAVLMSFDKIYSYRLYEVLKSNAYIHKGCYSVGDEYCISYGLSELKLTVGVVDTNAESVSRALRKPNPNFDHIVNDISKDKNFNDWSDFKKKVINVAVNEINEKSDLDLRYELIREGLGGKVTQIIFYFKKKEEYNSYLINA
jgi:plasmid replication initiation protein